MHPAQCEYSARPRMLSERELKLALVASSIEWSVQKPRRRFFRVAASWTTERGGKPNPARAPLELQNQ
ncbi:hypothetical protein [Rhizobacter sp. Root29]|uniref:hypothetical protein n=1 Tax=Rhizobacter sp. Root29 TaxID=1736511 RepID=UPI001F336286|nr:hypothetical protein [Rhizobacter sp. Root29]